MPRAGLAIAIALLLISRASARGDELADERAGLMSRYAAQLNELAAWCRNQGDQQAADELAAWLPRRSSDRLTLFVLSSASTEQLARPAQGWRAEWHKLRVEQADALAKLSARAARDAQASLAYELLTEAARENPDHKLARRVLGYVRFRDGWYTPFEIKQLNSGKVYHEKFGWLPKSHVARYERGQRFYRGRWMSQSDEEALRNDMARGWRIESDHYAVTTNHSLEAGVELSKKLERLHAVWQQAFAGYLVGKAELVRRFEGKGTRRDATQHVVVYYRDRAEYNAALRPSQPQIEISLGIYFARARTGYFFAGEDQEHGTINHEATHQLFQETRPAVAEPGRDHNFWIVEGIACYMESLTDAGDGWVTLGGAHAGRMDAARERLRTGSYNQPIAHLVDLGMTRLQQEPQLAALYGEAAAFADFLMHARQGKYREPLVSYLESIYSGHATAGTLAELTGEPYDKLDREYRDFMTDAVSDAPAVGAR
jgi:hypothetical protein